MWKMFADVFFIRICLSGLLETVQYRHFKVKHLFLLEVCNQEELYLKVVY